MGWHEGFITHYNVVDHTPDRDQERTEYAFITNAVSQ
jgi:hypothetical protein